MSLNSKITEIIGTNRKFKVHSPDCAYTIISTQSKHGLETAKRLDYRYIEEDIEKLLCYLRVLTGSTDIQCTSYIEISPHIISLNLVGEETNTDNPKLFYGCYLKISYKKVIRCEYRMYKEWEEKSTELPPKTVENLVKTLFEILPIINQITYTRLDNIIYNRAE